MSLPPVPDAPRVAAVRRRPRHPSPEARLAAQLVGAAMDVKPSLILADVRGRPDAACARQVVMYVLNTARGLSLAEVALAIGRDRSTVAHGVRVVEERREEGHFDEWLARIEDSLRAAPLPHADAGDE